MSIYIYLLVGTCINSSCFYTIHNINTLMFKIHCLQWYSGNSSAEEKQLFTDEINVMKRVSDGNNPHVLKMLGCVTATNPMMLVLQFVPQGNLKNYLRAMKTADDVRNVIVSKFLPRCLLCRAQPCVLMLHGVWTSLLFCML